MFPRNVILVCALLMFYAGKPQWTLQRCVDTAIARNLTIWQEKLNVRLNEIALKQSRLNVWPTLNASVSQNFNFGRSLDQTTYQYINQSAATNAFALNSGLVLFNGNQLRNAIKQSVINAEASRLDLEQTRNDISLAVIEAFVEIIYAKEAVRNATLQVASTRALIEQTKLFVQAGKKAESDLVQLQAQLASDQYNLGVAQSGLATNRLLLQQLMEVPYQEGFDIAAPALATPAEADEYGSATLVFEDALTTQPYIRSGQLRIESARKGLDIARGSLWPRLSFSGGLGSNYSNVRKLADLQSYTMVQPIGFLKSDASEEVLGYVAKDQYTYRSFPFFSQLSQNFNQYVSISLSIPIFNNRQVRMQIEKEQIAIENARIEDRLNRNDLRKKVEQAFVDSRSARLKYEAACKAFEAEQLSWQNLELRFQASKSTATDILIEKNRLAAQESQVLQAKYELILRQKILDFYEGRPLTF